MTKRELVFQDGKSDKFWNIEVQNETHTVTYGRRGTAGQVQSKSFSDAAAAESAAQKLIQEKLKKGYVDAASGATSSVAASSPTAQTTSPTPAKSSKAKKASAPAVADSNEISAASSQEPRAEELPVSPVSQPDSEVSRTIKLDPQDWLWATWRPRELQLRPEAPKFEVKEALARLAKVPGDYPYTPWQWSKARIASALTPEEAHFWFEALISERAASQNYSRGYRNLAVTELNNQLGGKKFTGKLSTKDVVKPLSSKQWHHAEHLPEIVAVLSSLFSPADVISTIFEVSERRGGASSRRYNDLPFEESLASGLATYVLPYVTADELAGIKQVLRAEVVPSKWPTDFYTVPSLAFFLAAQLGLHDELRALVQSWKDDLYGADNWVDHYHRPQEIVFGLGSAEEVRTQMRRLKLRMRKTDHIRAWLAHTEYSDLDWLRDSILGAASHYSGSNKEEAEKLTQTFALVEAPEAAPHMLQLMLESRAPRPARAWLDEHPEHTIAGLAPVAAGRGKLAEAAVEFLRSLKRRGYEEHIRVRLESQPDDVASRVRPLVLEYQEKHFEPFIDQTTPGWLREAMEQSKTLVRSPVGWVHAADLPPITCGDHQLNNAQAETLLSALQKSKADAPHTLVAAVKSHVDRASLDAFAWSLFERWLAEGAPTKDKWAMLTLGYLGGDVSALKLAPMIRVWPGESQHQRAVTGLECLRAIGTDTALMQINGIAQKVKFKGLQGKAVECMEGIARDRGLSRAQLEDRVVPDCDLDERGSRIFDFGPRQFRFILGPDMKPLVREEGATLTKPRPDLPKPNTKDDEAKSNAALAEWKLLKKQIAEVVKIQAVRLEQAMVLGRRWTPEEFETLLVRHPLMTNLVRLLVWEAASGNRRATFRVTEDLSLADASDEPFDLGDFAHVGIAHPLHMPTQERAAWGELFSDYEIVPPFHQLGRAIYSLEGDEVNGQEITRFGKVKVPPETLNFGLEKQGWVVGMLHDHGDYHEHVKTFESAGVKAIVEYEPGLFKGYREGWEPQTITRCYFLAATEDHQDYWNTRRLGKALPLSEIDPVAISEVLNDLASIAAKGQPA